MCGGFIWSEQFVWLFRLLNLILFVKRIIKTENNYPIALLYFLI